MATIWENIERLLRFRDIRGVTPIEYRPDRVFAWDMFGELEADCRRDTAHWMSDVLDPLHGALLGNFRERAIPSLQVCIHPISQINHPNLPRTSFCEIDFDEEAPTNPVTLTEHLGICIIHAIRHSTTNEDDIYRGLEKRLGMEAA